MTYQRIAARLIQNGFWQVAGKSYYRWTNGLRVVVSHSAKLPSYEVRVRELAAALKRRCE